MLLPCLTPHSEQENATPTQSPHAATLQSANPYLTLHQGPPSLISLQLNPSVTARLPSLRLQIDARCLDKSTHHGVQEYLPEVVVVVGGVVVGGGDEAPKFLAVGDEHEDSLDQNIQTLACWRRAVSSSAPLMISDVYQG